MNTSRLGAMEASMLGSMRVARAASLDSPWLAWTQTGEHTRPPIAFAVGSATAIFDSDRAAIAMRKSAPAGAERRR